eukprot:GHUV01054365.1.p1 GENE.GHUV01054365.1~~GHUV01054365.1.p1  ORF type:complete len:146 (-),score=18.78 GHUV01054365.1:45-482(-)
MNLQARITPSVTDQIPLFFVVMTSVLQIAGHKTAFGNATWQETHPTATHTAPPVQQLLAAGATVVGKTHMDELAYSLNGENVHYGTPVNVAAPGRIPGGSSSGSAVSAETHYATIVPTIWQSSGLPCCSSNTMHIVEPVECGTAR